MSQIAFGIRVKEAREKLKAEYSDIAIFSQITPERLALIEQGKDKTINFSEVKNLAFALGVTYTFLICGKESA